MNGIKADPDIKMDPDAITPSGSGYMDDDFYEDTGELQLPQKGSEKDVWLTRIPQWLYEAVSKWEDITDGNENDQMVIGEVLCMPDPNRPGQIKKDAPIRMILNNRSIVEKQLPQAFDLTMSKAEPDTLGNTYIFTEKDLPGYKPSGLGQGKMGTGLGVRDPKARVGKWTKYKKAIPKQTVLLGATTREYHANPLHTREYIEFSKKRTRKAIQGNEERTNIVDNLNDHRLGLNAQKMFKSFIRPPVANKPQTNKAARIPRNDLIDLLHQCFDQYTYWSMKALKNRTKQPEAYLKEVLQEIAQLVKTGPFASNWMRHGVYNRDLSQQVNALAPGEEDGDDDGDEEMEMEDVV
jgi:transcription initiation factor TFIIF subunit beta